MRRIHFIFIRSLFLGVTLIPFGCEKDKNMSKGSTDALFNYNLKYGTLMDEEGNVYKTITIGNQTWMAENLRSIKYNDGTIIPTGNDYSDWRKLLTPAYFTYSNTKNLDTIRTFGMLYNGYVIASGKLAPKGWHIPTLEEWEILINYLGGPGVAASHLKEWGKLHWDFDKNVDNSSGFTALPGGMRNYYTFEYFSELGFWWTTSGNDPYLRIIVMDGYNKSVGYGFSTIELGYSVRCIKD